MGVSEQTRIQGVVTMRRDLTADLWIVTVRPGERIGYRAGQYVTVGLPLGTKTVERPYSVASSPEEAELEFFIERVPDGALTPHLYEIPVRGEILLRRVAKGRFIFDDSSGHKNHFMVATVTGVAPFVSMVRQMVANARRGEPIRHSIVVLQSASLSLELGYCEELADYARQYPWFHYVPSISRLWLDPGWTGEKGRAEDVARKHLDAFGFTPADTTAYMCGNPNMIDNVKQLLRRVGFPKESCKEEIYWVEQKAG